MLFVFTVHIVAYVVYSISLVCIVGGRRCRMLNTEISCMCLCVVVADAVRLEADMAARKNSTVADCNTNCALEHLTESFTVAGNLVEYQKCSSDHRGATLSLVIAITPEFVWADSVTFKTFPYIRYSIIVFVKQDLIILLKWRFVLFFTLCQYLDCGFSHCSIYSISLDAVECSHCVHNVVGRHFGKFRMTVSLKWVIRSTFMN